MANLKNRLTRLESASGCPVGAVERYRKYLQFLTDLERDEHSVCSEHDHDISEVTYEEAEESLAEFWRQWQSYGLPYRDTRFAPSYEDHLLLLEQEDE